MFFRRPAPALPQDPWVSLYNCEAIGDTLLGVPLYRLLRQRHPDASLHFVAPSPVGPLLELCGEIDVYRPVPGMDQHKMELDRDTCSAGTKLFMNPMPALERSLWDAIGRPREIVAFGDSTMKNRLHPLGVPYRVIELVSDPSIHAAHGVLRQYSGDEAFDPSTVAPLATGNPFPHEVDTIYLHPGASFEWKVWGGFLRLGFELRLMGFDVVMVQGPGQKIHRDWNGPILKRPSLLELARRCESAYAYVGNDSGTTHLAGLMGTRTVALFGPTDHTRWYPLGPQVTAISRCDLPHEPDYCTHIRGDSCLHRITVDEVIDALL